MYDSVPELTPIAPESIKEFVKLLEDITRAERNAEECNVLRETNL